MSELFNSEFFSVSLSDSPCAKGHLSVVNSKPLPSCSDNESNLFFLGVSQCATALFELLGAHGTNIIINDKDDSLSGEIISRMQNDGLDFLWQPTRGDPAELDSVAKSIKDAVDLLVWKKDNPDSDSSSSAFSDPEVMSQETSETGEKKVNYLLKKLNRRP